MKYLVLCLLMLPLISSCVPNDPYYRPGPGVEVYPSRPNHHYHHNRNGYYRPAPQSGSYHGHPGPIQQGPVVVQPEPQSHVTPQSNAHGHNGTPPTNPGNLAPAAMVPPKTVHGHDDQKNVHSHDEAQSNVHGHN